MLIKSIFIGGFCSPEVALCGYSLPHPSEPEMHLRIQLVPGASAVVTPAEMLKKGLNDIVSMCDHVEDTFNQELGCEASSYESHE